MDSDNAVEEIVSQIGEIAGYTNLSLYNTRTSNMMLEIVFETAESIQKAISTGISYDGMVYRGTPWVDEAKKKTIKVNLTHIPLKLHQNLGEVIKDAMQPYGEVLQIRNTRIRLAVSLEKHLSS
jgi:hypothetical protein